MKEWRSDGKKGIGEATTKGQWSAVAVLRLG
jgi:hypothetical protein